MLIGYAITLAVYASFILMLAAIALERKGLRSILREFVDGYSLLALVLILLFFVTFSVLFVSPVEQLYFDENIYQGIAMNILSNGNALWCQYGTAFAHTCYVNALYHDPVGWSAFIAIAFALFGIGTQTAYNLELLVGALSIAMVFLLSGALTRKRSCAVVSALAFSTMPQLFIWSRTQADFDLPFMMLAVLTMFLFVMFTRRKSLYSFAAFAFSLDLVSYMRIEALALVGIFALLLIAFGERGIVETARERIALVLRTLRDNTAALLLLFAFVLLLVPEVYYVALEAQNPAYGQPAGQPVLSLSNFNSNMGTNALFLLGQFNAIGYYPMAFSYTITPLAALGVLFLALDRRRKNRFGILLLLGLWFLAYFLFYTSFYAGAANYGVDSRFMLQLIPQLCVLSAFAFVGAGDGVRALVRKVKAHGSEQLSIYASGICVIAMGALLLAYPFYLLEPNVAISPSAMPQQSVILKAINTFYSSYNAVPQNCVVFSFTPDIWFEANRSSAQIGYLGGVNGTIKSSLSSYSCHVIDYGYWCVVPPFHSTTCAYDTSHYKVENLTVPAQTPSGFGVTYYKILNYT